MKSTVAVGLFVLASGMWGGTEAFAGDESGTIEYFEIVDDGIVVVLQPEDEQSEAVIIWMAVDTLPPNPPPNPPESYPATMYQLAMAAVTGSQVTFVNVEPIVEGLYAWTGESALVVDWDTEFQESP